MTDIKPAIASTLLALLALASGCNSAKCVNTKQSELAVMSFNIRNGKANDGENRWDKRKPLVYQVINQYQPDLVGLQEAYRFQMDQLIENLPRFGEIGTGRDGGTRGEYSAILYLKERFTVQDQGTFWLSDTPDKVSRHWGNRYHRVCTWAHLIDKTTGRALYIYNTHFDHQSQNARLKSAQLIAKHIDNRPSKDPVIFTGDFNAGEDNPAIKLLKHNHALRDTFRVLHPDQQHVGTGNGGYTGKRDGAKIDYIFVTPGIETLTAHIDQQPRDGRYLSDHYPVTATLRLPQP